MVKTTRMGQTGIRAVLKCHPDPAMEEALRQQLKDYDMLEDEAKALAASRGWRLKKPHSMLQDMIERMTWMKLQRYNRRSRIADMIIQGNTQGMIHSLRDLHSYEGEDQEVRKLNQKLVYCEIENIRQMKPYL